MFCDDLFGPVQIGGGRKDVERVSGGEEELGPSHVRRLVPSRFVQVDATGGQSLADGTQCSHGGLCKKISNLDFIFWLSDQNQQIYCQERIVEVSYQKGDSIFLSKNIFKTA